MSKAYNQRQSRQNERTAKPSERLASIKEKQLILEVLESDVFTDGQREKIKEKINSLSSEQAEKWFIDLKNKT